MTTATKNETRTTHTPGPWQVTGEKDLFKNKIDDLVIVASSVGPECPDDELHVCNVGSFMQLVHPVEAEGSVNLANARLIAAAPDLLAACRLFVTVGVHHEWRHQFPELWESVQTAIRKAEGGVS